MWGPPWTLKVTCPSPGSYNDNVPIIQSNTHILLVPFAISNQYNSNLLSVLEVLKAVCCQEHMPDAKSIGFRGLTHGGGSNQNSRQSLLDRSNVDTVEDETSSLQLITERENEKHHSVFGNNFDRHEEPHHDSTEYHQEQLQIYWRWVPFMRQNIFVWFPTYFLHQDYLSNRASEREYFLNSRYSNMPETNTSDAEMLDGFQIQNNHEKIQHENIELYSNDDAERNIPTSFSQSESNTDEAVTTEGSHEVLKNPLIELMESKNVQVSLNTSSDSFELKISGQENFFKFLQSVNFHIKNYSAKEENMASLNPTHETGANIHETNENNVNNHLQDFLNVNILDVFSRQESNDANTHQNHTPNSTMIDNLTNEEIVQEETLTNESSEFVGFSANNLHSTGNSVNDSQKIPVLVNFVENTPHPLLSATYALHDPHPEGNFSLNYDSTVDSDSEGFQTLNSTEESGNPNSTESRSSINSSKNNISLYPEIEHADVVYTSTMTPIDSDGITLNVNEPGKVGIENRPRRNVQVTPVTFVHLPQRNQLSLLDFMQGKDRTGTILEALSEPSPNEMGTGQKEIFDQNIKYTKSYREENTESTEALESVSSK